ncbi:MAG: hypothetical protein WB819_12740, partial [Terriglobia bacterium]
FSPRRKPWDNERAKIFPAPEGRKKRAANFTTHLQRYDAGPAPGPGGCFFRHSVAEGTLCCSGPMAHAMG